MSDVATHMRNDAGALVAQHPWQGRVSVVHLVELRVANAAREELDDDLVGLRVGDLQLIDYQSLFAGRLDRRYRFHGSSHWMIVRLKR